MNRFQKLGMLVLWGAILWTTPICAQIIPSNIGDGRAQLSEEDLRRRRLEEEQIERAAQKEPEILIEGIVPAELGAHSDKKVIPLQSVEFENDTYVLSQSELDEITAPYLGQTVSLQDLYRIAHEIDQLYDRKGVLGRIAIPSQNVKEGHVRMRFIEGRVGDIQIKQRRPFSRNPEDEVTIYNTKTNEKIKWRPFYYRPNSFLNQFSAEKGEIVRTQRLESELLRYNMLYEQKVQLELEAGDEVGETDMIYHIKNPKPLEMTVFYDNYGRPTTGEYRTGTMMSLHNLTGLADNWFVSATASPDGDLADTYLGGSIPVHESGLALTGSFEYTNYALVSGDFAVLEVDGWSRRSEFGLAMPLITRQERLLRGYVKGMVYDSQNYFDGTPQQDFNVESVIVGITQERFGTDFYRMFDTSLSYGRVVNALSEKDWYTVWRGSWTGVKKLDDRWSLLGRLGFQIGTSELPSIEMFQIGGVASVRGYTEGILAGDAGYYINLELHRQVYSWQFCKRRRCTYGSPYDTATISMFGFADHGGVFPYKGAGYQQNNDDYLVSAGFGANLNYGEHFAARALISMPMYDNKLDYDAKDARFNFMVQYKF